MKASRLEFPPVVKRRLPLGYMAEALAVCLLLLMAINLLTVVRRKSLTNDELIHIPAGCQHLFAGNFQINNEHPPLIKMLAAAPLVFLHPIVPSLEMRGTKAPSDYYDSQLQALKDFWEANRSSFKTISFWARAPMIAITLALGWLIFVYARQLCGARAGVFAVALFSLEPTVLAHGRVVQTDIPAAFAYLLFFFALHVYAKARSWRHAFALGLASGLALITKFSLIVVVPLLLLAFAVLIWIAPHQKYKCRYFAAQCGFVALVTWMMVNAAYRFRSPSLNEMDVGWINAHTPFIAHKVTLGIEVLSKIAPTYFLVGLYNVTVHNHAGDAASLLGVYSNRGWWYYFPIAFALKTTIPFLLLSITALVWAVWRVAAKREERFLALLIPLTIYTSLAMMSHINIGIRHFLPAYPFLFILGGGFLDWLLQFKSTCHSKRAGLMAVTSICLLMCWMVIEAARAYPDYMSYMNQLAWRHPHWHYLSDSNVEWGDDVGALAEYLRARGETKVRGALSGGWYTLQFYGVDYIDMFAPAAEKLPETRYVAIGAGHLNGSTTPEAYTHLFDEYRQRTPEAIFGGSIYLYREKE